MDDWLLLCLLLSQHYVHHSILVASFRYDCGWCFMYLTTHGWADSFICIYFIFYCVYTKYFWLWNIITFSGFASAEWRCDNDGNVFNGNPVDDDDEDDYGDGVTIESNFHLLYFNGNSFVYNEHKCLWLFTIVSVALLYLWRLLLWCVVTSLISSSSSFCQQRMDDYITLRSGSWHWVGTLSSLVSMNIQIRIHHSREWEFI